MTRLVAPCGCCRIGVHALSGLVRSLGLLGSISCGRLFQRRLPSLFLHLHSFLGWLERGNHLFARQGRIQGAAPEVCPFTHPTDLVSGSSGLPTAENLHSPSLETFHPFTHFSYDGRPTTTVQFLMPALLDPHTNYVNDDGFLFCSFYQRVTRSHSVNKCANEKMGMGRKGVSGSCYGSDEA